MNIDTQNIVNDYLNEIYEKEKEQEKEQIKDNKIEFDIYYCQKCQKYSNTTYDGQIVCINCCTEYGSIIDGSAEWRNYGDDSRGTDTTRCGSVINPLLIESSYGTTIGYTKDPTFIKLRQTINWISTNQPERTLRNAFNILTQNGNFNNLSKNIITRSHELFYDLIQKKIEIDAKSSRGNFLDGLIATCTFYACKEFGLSRTKKDIAKMHNISESDFTRAKKLFEKLMPEYMSTDIVNNQISYINLIDRFCQQLNMTEEHIDMVKDCVTIVHDKKLLSKNSTESIVCGCIYFICNMLKLDINKNDISKVCDISNATINKTYKALTDYTHILI